MQINHANGTTCRIVEFEVRTLDEFADCIDVLHHETFAAAFECAHKEIASGAIAVVIEKHTSWHGFSGYKPDRYETKLRLGNPDVLRAWEYEEN